jgi:glucose-1-phosphate thymidylyltransferase
MVALLLAAGYGTRMGEAAGSTPKALLPVADRPLVDYLLEQIAGLPEITGVHLVTNRRYVAVLREWADFWRKPLGGQRRHLEIHDDGSTTPENRRGAAGDLAFLLEEIGIPEGALVAGTDNILRFSLQPFWKAFRTRRENLLLAVREENRDSLRRSGVLEIAEEDRVLCIHEKPDDPPSEWACPCIYAMRGSALERIRPRLEAGHPPDDLGQLMDALTRQATFRAFRSSGSRLHVGTPAEWAEADRILRVEPAVLDA